MALRALTFAILLAACRSAPTGAPLSQEPLPAEPPLGEMLCISGAAHMETLANPMALQAEIGRIQELGIRLIRFELFWSSVERTPGEYDLDWLDAPLQALEAAHIRPIVMLGYGNALYNGRSDGDAYYPTPPEPYARFAAAVAARFGTRILAYELWNEPNAGYRFYKPLEDPAAFGVMVSAATTSIKQSCPTCQVLFGGVFWHPEVIMGGVRFIERAYNAAPELRTSIDGLAVHPYVYYPPTAAPDSAETPEVPLPEMMAQAGAATGQTPHPPEWITEVGWPVWGVEVDEQMQSSHLIKAAALANRSGARSFCWYDLQDGAHFEAFPPEDAFGLLRYDAAGPTTATPKPAFLTMKALSLQLGTMGYVRDRGAELGLTAPGDAALLFRTQDSSATILWSTTADPSKEVLIPVHQGMQVEVIDSYGIATPLQLRTDHRVLLSVDVNARILIESPAPKD